MNTEPKEQNNKLRPLFVSLAWITLPILGLLLLFVTTQSSTIPGALLPQAEDDSVSLATLNGLLGIILILFIILATNGVRKKTFFYHLRIGLWIGLAIYLIILVNGVIVAYTPTSYEECNTPLAQYNEHGSAVVPIQTDLGYGSGFAVANNETIVTAYHVIEGATDIKANYSAGQVQMTVISTAPQYDLALLKIGKPTDSFFTLVENYSVGDSVYAYGYPGNALTAGPPSISAGILSRVIDLASLRMTNQESPDGLEMVQTDAAINPGNSGGPLIGKCGVVGVVSSISDTSQLHDYLGSVSEQNIGFAVSSKTVLRAFPEITKK